MKYELEELEQRIHTPQLEGIGERLEDDVCEMLQRAGIYFRIFHRVKTPESIVDKINKDGYGFEDDEKRMQDLIGMRIVVYYYDDMKILQTVFDRTFARQGEWAVTDNSSEEFKASKLNGVYRIPDEYAAFIMEISVCIPLTIPLRCSYGLSLKAGMRSSTICVTSLLIGGEFCEIIEPCPVH